jgi:preprotein translocase subunit SecE
MAKEGSVAKASFMHELLQFGMYKPHHGKLVRQITFLVIAATVCIGCYRLRYFLRERHERLEYLLPGTIGILGVWLAFRLVNYPQFADFLISVEGELNKVSWPSKDEVIRSTIVVILMIFVLAAMLFGFDLLWRTFFELIGVIRTPAN